MNYTLSEDVVVLLVTYTTTEAAALLKTTPRRVMMVCDYWDIQHCGSGRARKYTASQLVDIGLRARLLLSKRYRKATAETLEQLANDIAAGAKATASLKKENKALRAQLSAVEASVMEEATLRREDLSSVKNALKRVERSLEERASRLHELESLQLAFTRIVRAQVK